MRCGYLTTGHAVTSRGAIPHVVCGGGELRAPVKLDFSRPQGRWQGELRPAPMVRNGRYVHALPGVGEILGSVIAQASRRAK